MINHFSHQQVQSWRTKGKNIYKFTTAYTQDRYESHTLPKIRQTNYSHTSQCHVRYKTSGIGRIENKEQFNTV